MCDLKIITRAEAKALGLKRYFTGKPCKHSHVAERFVTNGFCVECSYSINTKYSVENLSKISERKKTRYEENKSNENARSKKYRIENRDKVNTAALKRNKKYYFENREKLRDYISKYREKNRDRIKHIVAKYMSTPRGKSIKRKSESARRAVKLGHEINWTPRDHARVMALFQLAARRERDEGIKFHVDHIVPLSRGGAHHPSNMQVVTARFNLSKGARTEEEMRGNYNG